MLSVNDFFCGAGGMGLGFEQAGYKLSGAWDFDKYAVKSYNLNLSSKVKQVDIVNMYWYDVPYADVWAFGFPCQDISYSGKMAGLFKGKRSGMFFEVMRLLDEIKQNNQELPKILLAENVKGLKPYLETLESEYKERGYKMYFTIVNSNNFVPQNRDRYLVVGVHESIKEEFTFQNLNKLHILKLINVLESNVEDKYYLDNEKSQYIINEANNKGIVSDLENDIFTVLYNRKDGIVKKIDYSPTLSASDWRGLNQNQSKAAIVENGRIRKLTPREYARLQGFPDTYKIQVSNTQAYKQFGNAVSVPVARMVAEEIHKFLVYKIIK